MNRARANPQPERTADAIASLRQRLAAAPSIVAARARNVTPYGRDAARALALWKCDLKLLFMDGTCRVFTDILACEHATKTGPLVYFPGMEEDPAHPGQPNSAAYGPLQQTFVEFLIAHTLHHARAWGGIAAAFSGSAYAGTAMALAAFAATRGLRSATLGAGFIDLVSGRYQCAAVPGDDGVNHWIEDACNTAGWDELGGSGPSAPYEPTA